MSTSTPINTLKLHYNKNRSELCEIGKKYDTDKSSQRNNNNYKFCHPYTLFYHSLFKSKRNTDLTIAELGILDPSSSTGAGSLLMWKEYFTKAQIYGFDNNQAFIDIIKKNYNTDRITFLYTDVTNKENIQEVFSRVNMLYDIIIEDTTHNFEDQIRVIENTYQYLKPGGMLIIENIFKSNNEMAYINRLTPILEHFQNYYFVEFDHENKNSTGWNNDKLFILVKGGNTPIFSNTNKITIITPSYRVNNLLKLKNSIDFNYVDEWIIVYDGSKISDNPNLFKDQEGNKIKEYVFKGEGISGNPQRNFALSQISNQNTLLYYLDDDNIIHPDLYRLLDIIEDDKIYTFNSYKTLKGNDIRVTRIDTAMFIISFNLCKDKRWILEKYEADGYYISECYSENKDKHIYVDNDLCYCNKLA